MKDPTETLVNALNTLLANKVTYNGKKVKVFTRPVKASEIPIVKGQLYHYIEITEVTDSEAPRNADVFVHDMNFEIHVTVGFPGIGNKTVLNDIVNQVMQKIITAKGGKLSLGSDFTNVLTYLETAFELRENGLHKIITKVLRYRAEIDEV